MTLRERNRVAAKRITQAEALRLFRERGFDEVTIEEIAENTGMAASTIYRHFGTKENLVLWDEHDPAIDAAFRKTLPHQPPLDAIRDALIASLAPLYEEHLAFELDRIGYIFETPQLHAAALDADYDDRDDLTAALRSSLSRRNRDAAPLIAGASMVALDAALARWVKGKGKTPLAKCLADCFATLATLGAIT